MSARIGTFWFMLLMLYPGVERLAPAQALGGNVRIDKPLKNFKVAEPYGPPNETHTKSTLEGGQALPVAGGNTLLSDGVTLRTYTITNTPQIVVKCQDCLYNATNRDVHSAGPIQMQTADGKFQIAGTGFLWRQTNSSLFISNEVHTLIQNASLAQGTNNLNLVSGSETGPVRIDSVNFTYDGSGRGVWRDHVLAVGTNATGTNLVLRCDVLTAMVPADQQQVRSLLAQGNVAVDYHGLHATGAQLTYATDTGLIRITNKARWKAEQRYGSGDELILDRSNQVFFVNGHAFVHLPAQTMDEAGFLSYSNAPSSKSTNAPKRAIEIMSGNYEIRTNWASFRDGVRLDERIGTTNRGKMTSRTMVVTFSGSNQLQTLTADKNVVIEEGADPEKKRFTGAHAFYTHTNTTLEMTGQPQWQAGSRRGKGDLLQLNTLRSEMLVRGNAQLTLPAGELATQLGPVSTNAMPGSSTNNPTVLRPGKFATNQLAQIFSQEYTLRPDNSVFLGGVYATHPEMNWSCERLTVSVAGEGLTNVVARQNVVFDLANAKEKAHGTGDEAVYSFGRFNTLTNGFRQVNELRLTGTPAVFSNTNFTSRNSVIIWDRLTTKLVMPGNDYSIQGLTKGIATNIFALPKKKVTK